MKRVTITAHKNRKGAENMLRQASPPLRTDHESRLQWLLGFAQETSGPRTLAERRTVHVQVGAYLGGLLLRHKGEDGNGPLVMELGDPRMSDALPMRGADNQKPLEEKLALIRTAVRRIMKAFLSAPKLSFRVTGEIAWQRILDKAPGRAPTFRVQGVAADVREGITFCLLEDLAQAGALVRECPATGCGTVFVRRYRQEFCSTACRNRTNFRIWYQGTRKARKGTGMTPHARRRKRRPMYLRRARARGKPKPRAKYA
jgi:hypothetical protein